VNNAQNDFLKLVVPAAQSAMRKFGVPASITAAQAILESGWGMSALARQCYNFFGIKAVASAQPGSYQEFQTAEFVQGRRVAELARFARYPDPASGFEAHALLLATAVRYRPFMAACQARDLGWACRELYVCGYSTNPSYPKLLGELREEFDLEQYDIWPTPPAQAAEAVA
jgi:flagellum-specific peptidoglycan hydrolase FlgJ